MRELLPAGAALGGVEEVAARFFLEAPDFGLLGFLLAALRLQGRFARDARLMTIGGGTSEIMRDIIAKAVLK